MNIIQQQAHDFYFGHHHHNYKKFMDDLKYRLYDYKKASHKIEFIEYIITKTKIDYDNHMEKCTDPKFCTDNKYYQNALFFLQEELEEVQEELTENDFSLQERNSSNDAIVSILETLNHLKLGQEVSYDGLLEEINELKELYYLDKKTWSELFIGKVSGMVAGGVISETVSKQLVKFIADNYQDIIKNS